MPELASIPKPASHAAHFSEAIVNAAASKPAAQSLDLMYLSASALRKHPISARKLERLERAVAEKLRERKDRPVIVTLDGPAGAGKSSLAEDLQAVGFVHSNSGTLFRTVAYLASLQGCDFTQNSKGQLIKIARSLNEYPGLIFKRVATKVRGRVNPELIVVPFLEGRNLYTEIRSEANSLRTPIVAEIGEVRRALLPLRIEAAKVHHCVAEGRREGDETFGGKNGCPRATISFYVTCNTRERAKRQVYEQFKSKLCCRAAKTALREWRDCKSIKREDEIVSENRRHFSKLPSLRREIIEQQKRLVKRDNIDRRRRAWPLLTAHQFLGCARNNTPREVINTAHLSPRDVRAVVLSRILRELS